VKFQAKRLNFGGDPDAESDEGTGLPAPKLAKLKARRMAGIREAKECLAKLPDPGESLHVIATSRMDLTDVINGLLERIGTATEINIATLGYNGKNLSQMLAWLDTKQVGTLTLLASIFYRSHNGEQWAYTLDEFRKRRQRAACCHSHAKVVTLAFKNGQRLSIEGSANLCGNGSGREQFAMINDGGLHDWHAAWIKELVTKYEGKEKESGKEASEEVAPATGKRRHA
jgi:hypothetical protein